MSWGGPGGSEFAGFSGSEVKQTAYARSGHSTTPWEPRRIHLRRGGGETEAKRAEWPASQPSHRVGGGPPLNSKPRAITSPRTEGRYHRRPPAKSRNAFVPGPRLFEPGARAACRTWRYAGDPNPASRSTTRVPRRGYKGGRGYRRHQRGGSPSGRPSRIATRAGPWPMFPRSTVSPKPSPPLRPPIAPPAPPAYADTHRVFKTAPPKGGLSDIPPIQPANTATATARYDYGTGLGTPRPTQGGEAFVGRPVPQTPSTSTHDPTSPLIATFPAPSPASAIGARQASSNFA